MSTTTTIQSDGTVAPDSPAALLSMACAPTTYLACTAVVHALLFFLVFILVVIPLICCHAFRTTIQQYHILYLAVRCYFAPTNTAANNDSQTSSY